MNWLDKNILYRPVQFYSTFNEQLLCFKNNNKYSTFTQHLLDNWHTLDTTESIMQTLHVINERSHMNTYKQYNICQETKKQNQFNKKYQI
jgi:hypothetical protein